MPAYRIRLTLQSPLASPALHSGTLFGHLCWAKRLTEGDAALTDWLTEQARAPLLLSDALPADYLPRPLLAPAERPPMATHEQSAVFLKQLQEEKKLRKTAFIHLDDFLALRTGFSETKLWARLRNRQSKPAGKTEQVRAAHNTINRHTNTTPDSGGLYFVDETWFNTEAGQFDVYAQGAISQPALQSLFDRVGEFGFGRDASLGRGRFQARVEIANAKLFQHNGNRLLSLSHGVLSPNMQAARYKLHTHYGKLGGLYAGGGRSPFKQPLLLTRPGMTFSPADTGPYGALLADVHPHHPEIRQHAWHLCLPYTEVT